MRCIEQYNVQRNEIKALAIVEAFLAEWLSFNAEWRGGPSISVTKRSGCRIRYRNRLVREAGFSYNEALYAISKAIRLQ